MKKAPHRRNRPWARAVMLVMALGAAACGHTTGTGHSSTRAADEAISSAVKEALVSDLRANLTRIEVDVEEGAVYLSGEVARGEMKLRAQELAGRVAGVKRVIDKIEVEP